MNKYRTHLCSELNASNLNNQVILSGWIDTIRDHGNLIFIDLRDNYGITQCVVDAKHQSFDDISNLNHESVVSSMTINDTSLATLSDFKYSDDKIGVEYDKKNIEFKNVTGTIVVQSKTESILPLFIDRFFEDETYIYVCQNKTCQRPETNINLALEQVPYIN